MPLSSHWLQFYRVIFHHQVIYFDVNNFNLFLLMTQISDGTREEMSSVSFVGKTPQENPSRQEHLTAAKSKLRCEVQSCRRRNILEISEKDTWIPNTRLHLGSRDIGRSKFGCFPEIAVEGQAILRALRIRPALHVRHVHSKGRSDSTTAKTSCTKKALLCLTGSKRFQFQ